MSASNEAEKACVVTFESCVWALSEEKNHKYCAQRTQPTPVQAMRGGVFVSVWFRNHSRADVLHFGPLTRRVRSSAAEIDMDVPSHGRTNEVAHHRCSFVISRESATFQFESGVVRSVYSPASLRHRTVTGCVLLLGVTYEADRRREESAYITDYRIDRLRTKG